MDDNKSEHVFFSHANALQVFPGISLSAGQGGNQTLGSRGGREMKLRPLRRRVVLLLSDSDIT